MSYADMTVDELKAELEDRELPVSGNKSELIERLEADDAAETEDPVEDEAPVLQPLVDGSAPADVSRQSGWTAQQGRWKPPADEAE